MLPDDWLMYQGSLAKARQPFAMIRSPFGAEVLRNGVAKGIIQPRRCRVRDMKNRQVNH